MEVLEAPFCRWDEIQTVEMWETISKVFMVPDFFLSNLDLELSVFPNMILGDGIPLAPVWGNT